MRTNSAVRFLLAATLAGLHSQFAAAIAGSALLRGNDLVVVGWLSPEVVADARQKLSEPHFRGSVVFEHCLGGTLGAAVDMAELIRARGFATVARRQCSSACAIAFLAGRHRSVDARERQIDKDRPAYKRLRDEGHQPRSMMGSHELEAKATDDWYIKTGGLVSVPDNKKAEVQEALATGAAERWSPVEQVHAKRSA